jgi:hypothetical protein
MIPSLQGPRQGVYHSRCGTGSNKGPRIQAGIQHQQMHSTGLWCCAAARYLSLLEAYTSASNGERPLLSCQAYKAPTGKHLLGKTCDHAASLRAPDIAVKVTNDVAGWVIVAHVDGALYVQVQGIQRLGEQRHGAWLCTLDGNCHSGEQQMQMPCERNHAVLRQHRE